MLIWLDLRFFCKICLMLKKVQKILAEFQALEKELAALAQQPEPQKLKKLTKRHAEIAANLDLFREFVQAHQTQTEAEKILASKETELQELATEEIAAAKQTIQDLTAKIKLALLPKNPRDTRDIILEVRAGTGGEEAALFADELARCYLRFAENQNFQTEILNKSEAEAGGVKEIIIRITGKNVYAQFKFEAGTHRVQRVPKTEAKGRLHTSAVTVAVLPEAEEVEIALKPEDLRIDTFCASGAGGQHVNRTESAIRITHLPSGLTVSCQNARSQHQNKEQALRMLRSRLFEFEQNQAAQAESSARAKMVGSGDRSEKIRTYNFPQDRVTDHRIHQNFSNLPKILTGDLSGIVESLRLADQTQRLEDNLDN